MPTPTSRSHSVEIAANGNRSTLPNRAPTALPAQTSHPHTPPSSHTSDLPMPTKKAPESMSKRSQFAVVASATLVFAGLLVYLSSVLYPLVVLGGAYAVMQQDSRLWRGVYARIERLKSLSSGDDKPQDDLSTAKRVAVSSSAATVELRKPPSTAPPTKRRSRIVTVKNASSTSKASLRVTDVGVTSDGLPSELPETSDKLLECIVEPNSIEPYEFENDFMKGKLLFLLQRPDSETHAYSALFDGKRRLFWVQMQVQFKKVPSGILYIGGEVPRSMNLGFFTGGLTKVILTVLQSLVRGLHCSFGQLFPSAVKIRDQEELPHICFPLYTAVDQFVATRPGEQLPVLGSTDFGESKESMAARRKHGQPMYQYNTSDTYSFHFHSFFIDFAQWRLNGIPGMRDCDLSVFWDDMPLRLCAYSLKPRAGVDPNSEAEAKKAVHSWSAKEYKFCFQLSHKIQDEFEFQENGGDATIGPDGAGVGPDDMMGFAPSGRRLSAVEVQQHEIQTELSRFEFSVPAWFEYFSTSRAHTERRVGYAIRVRERDEPEMATATSGELQSSPSAPVKREYFVLLTAVAAFSPLAYVERELSSASALVRRGSLRSGKHAKTLEESISVTSKSSRYAKIEDERQFLEFQLQQLAQKPANSQCESTLHARVALLELLQQKGAGSRTSLSAEWPFLSSLLVRKNSFGSSINVISESEGNCVVVAPPPASKDAQQLHAASQIIRAVSSTCWRNEWVTLDKTQRLLRFFRMMASSSSFTISLDAVLVLEQDSTYSGRGGDDGGAGGAGGGGDDQQLFWLRIVTIEKCHHFAFASHDDRHQWMLMLRTEIEWNASRSMELLVKQPILASCQRVDLELFVDSNASSKSRGAKRYVLNDRCDYLSFHVASCAPSVDFRDANAIVATALRLAIRLQRDRLEEYSTRDLLVFLDTVSLLKWTSLTQIERDETARKVFLLNLYHLLLLHASILGFLPKSKTQWSKFFNGTSYNVGGHYFSIAEIEHGLIRAPMASLKLAIAFLVIPKISDSDDRAPFRLTRGDFRVNFALNCLTKSCPSAIAVFTTAQLERQLDHVTSLAVDHIVSYDRELKIVYLPKVCEWYRLDFTSDPTSKWQQSCMALLRKYLRGTKAQLIDYVLQHEPTLLAKCKFAKYDYRFHESVTEATGPVPSSR